MLVPLAEASPATCGAKAATLAALARAGLPVPAGFVVLAAVHRAAADGAPDAPTPPAGLHAALGDALAALGDPPVAVRSSATDEDGAHASAAGQYATVLGVQGADAVTDAVRTCWASLCSARATAYRATTRRAGHDHPGGEPAMGVLVQRLVDADVSGVLFTPAEPGGATLVEAAWGLGGVVGGTATPDTYRVGADGAVTRTAAPQRNRVDRDGTGVSVREVPVHARTRPPLDDATARAVAHLGERVAAVLGPAQDVEWAVADGTPWVLQARPVTAAPPPPTPPAAPRSPTALVGTPGSAGVATGPARVVHGPADLARVRPGDVLVCPWTDPAWTPLLRVVAGVVTESGGVLSHAAIVARERRIPAVLGVAGATATLRDGDVLTIDGAAGTVTTHP